jgi:hypothetical protein
VLLYGRHLPRELARRGRSQIVVNLLLLVFISLAPGVSGWGHLGGGVAGALTALVLHFQRFGPPALRWLALLLLVPLPWVGVKLIERQRATSKSWHEAEKTAFQRAFGPEGKTIEEALQQGRRTYQASAEDLLEGFHFKRRDPGRVAKALEELQAQQKALDALAARLAGAGPYRNPKVEQRRQDKLEETQALSEKIASARRRLQEEKEEGDFEEKSLGRIHKTTSAADVLYKRQVQPLLHQRPRSRNASQVDKVRTALARQQKELRALVESLGSIGPFVSETAETARTTARQYAGAQAKLCDLARRALAEGAAWTDQDREQLRRQEKAVSRLRGQWQDLVTR